MPVLLLAGRSKLHMLDSKPKPALNTLDANLLFPLRIRGYRRQEGEGIARIIGRGKVII
jgi:hypothetical protein